ncbi:MAG: acyclic terpene utilization AtuA family protein, partial [Xanthobacteraceae bacterium]
MKDISVRIGGASGFWGDSSVALKQLVERGNVQFAVFDYLAELTMSLLAAARMKDPALGYATDFVEQLRPNLAEVMRRGIRLVSNAGGVNSAGCAAAVAALAKELGLSPKIAIVEGDDVLPLLPELRREDVREFETGRPLPETIQTASAYLGAIPIKHALDQGADIVITGR